MALAQPLTAMSCRGSVHLIVRSTLWVDSQSTWPRRRSSYAPISRGGASARVKRTGALSAGYHQYPIATMLTLRIRRWPITPKAPPGSTAVKQGLRNVAPGGREIGSQQQRQAEE